VSLKGRKKLRIEESPLGGAYQIQEEGRAGGSARLQGIAPDPKKLSVAELHRLVSIVAPTWIDMDIPYRWPGEAARNRDRRASGAPFRGA